MRPRRPAAEDAHDDLFRSRPDAVIDPRHRPVRLAKAINWSVFDEAFDPLYAFQAPEVECIGKDKVFIVRQKRGITPTIKREFKRCNAVEPAIGHMKDDGHIGRCFLKGAEGDAVNAIIAAVGHNLRLLARWFLLFFACLRLSNPAGSQNYVRLAA